MNAALQLARITKVFSGIKAVQGVDFEVLPGEIHALVGENGAGKSTLIKIMSGVQRPDGGEIYVNGHQRCFSSPREAFRVGIATVHQELLLFPELSVAENIFLGHAPRNRAGGIHWRDMRARAREILSELQSHDVPVDALVRELSVANRQRVEIARALSLKPQVLIMDEPSAALTDADTEGLLQLVRRLRNSGVGIVYVSHRMHEVFALADRVTVLRDGRRVDTRPIGETGPAHLVSLMVGRSVDQLYPRSSAIRGEAVLELRHLSCGHRVQDISFALHAGEILGIAGLVGSGRTELAHAIFGITPATSGTLLIAGQSATITAPTQARDLGIAYVPEDRGLQGLISSQSVRTNFSLANLKQFARASFIRRTAEIQATKCALVDFGIRGRGTEQPIRQLSGGNQQKIVLAKWLAIKPRILILDEPTRGIDGGAKAEIYKLITQLVQQGIAILLISSELPEVIGLSDRVLVMSRGRMCAVFDRDEATANRIGAAMIAA
jgi:rhamnose transport system ATP-binding protein